MSRPKRSSGASVRVSLPLTVFDRFCVNPASIFLHLRLFPRLLPLFCCVSSFRLLFAFFLHKTVYQLRADTIPYSGQCSRFRCFTACYSLLQDFLYAAHSVEILTASCCLTCLSERSDEPFLYPSVNSCTDTGREATAILCPTQTLLPAITESSGGIICLDSH